MPLPCSRGDGGRALLPRSLDHEAGYQRAAEGGGDGVDTLVEGVGLEGGEDELTDELVTNIGDVRADGAGIEGALADFLKVVDVAEVGGQGDDIVAVVLLDPSDGDGGIETAAVGEDDFVWHLGSLRSLLMWHGVVVWVDFSRGNVAIASCRRTGGMMG